MKLHLRVWLGICVATLLIGSVTSGNAASPCARCKLMAAWGLATIPSSTFDSKTIASFSGQILSVQDVSEESEVIPGIYILLKTSEGNLAVRLAPAYILKREGMDLQPYDEVEVKASKIPLNDRSGLIATQITKKGKTAILRSDSGKPTWKTGKE